MRRLGLWIRALRAPFFQAVLVPLALGTAAAWYRTEEFYLGYFLLALVGVVCINAGTNLANDYYDHKSGADELNRECTRFSGGSRVIQEGLMSPHTVFRASLIAFLVAAGIGLYLAYARGWVILAIGVVGIASGYFYTACPLSIGYRGWGELVAGIDCGPLVVLGAYYVQVQKLTLEVLLVSLPVGILVAAILYVNQFSDYRSDRAAAKANLVVRMGPERAMKGFSLLFISAYSVIILGCGLGLIPWIGLIALLSIPLAWRAVKAARANFTAGSGKKMVPAMAGTIATHLVTGLLLAGGYLVAGVWK